MRQDLNLMRLTCDRCGTIGDIVHEEAEADSPTWGYLEVNAPSIDAEEIDLCPACSALFAAWLGAKSSV